MRALYFNLVYIYMRIVCEYGEQEGFFFSRIFFFIKYFVCGIHLCGTKKKVMTLFIMQIGNMTMMVCGYLYDAVQQK